MPRITKPELLQRVIDAIRDGGWVPVVVGHRHPFVIRATKAEQTLNLRVYVWNCTHGGGKRARD